MQASGLAAAAVTPAAWATGIARSSELGGSANNGIARNNERRIEISP